MEILYLKKCCLAMKAVVPVLREYQSLIAKYLRGYLRTYKMLNKSVAYFLIKSP